jgi:hypothetical protein
MKIKMKMPEIEKALNDEKMDTISLDIACQSLGEVISYQKEIEQFMLQNSLNLDDSDYSDLQDKIFEAKAKIKQFIHHYDIKSDDGSNATRLLKYLGDG